MPRKIKVSLLNESALFGRTKENHVVVFENYLQSECFVVLDEYLKTVFNFDKNSIVDFNSAITCLITRKQQETAQWNIHFFDNGKSALCGHHVRFLVESKYLIVEISVYEEN